VPSLAFPAGQSMHDVWPVPLWYFPGVQRAHDAEPGDAAKEPGKHSTQAPMEVAHEAPPYEPAAHWVQVEVHVETAQEPAEQQGHTVAPASLYRPTAQQSHEEAEEAPVTLLNFPGTQSVHAELPKPNAYLPTAHAVQVALEVAPEAEE
jgi:hypothetical protein